MKKNLLKKMSILCVATSVIVGNISFYPTIVSAEDKIKYTLKEWVEVSDVSDNTPTPVYAPDETIHYTTEGVAYTEGGIINYVDKNGNFLFGGYDSILTDDIKDSFYFNEGLALVCKSKGNDGIYSYAYIDTQGKEVITFEANSASQFTNGYALVYNNDELYIMNKTGDKVKSIKYDGYVLNLGKADNGYFKAQAFPSDDSGTLYDTDLKYYNFVENDLGIEYLRYDSFPNEQGIVVLVGETKDWEVYEFLATVDGEILAEFKRSNLTHIEGNKYKLYNEDNGTSQLLEIAGSSSNTNNNSKQSNEIGATVDGVKVVFDQAPVIQEGRTLVPMRAIFEAMGAKVEWDEDTRTVTGTKGDTVVKMTIDNSIITVNSNSVTLDVAPTIINGRTMVPARAVAEALNAKVDWNNDTRTVVITQ